MSLFGVDGGRGSWLVLTVRHWMLQQWAPGHGFYPVTPHRTKHQLTLSSLLFSLNIDILGNLSESIKTNVEKVYFFPTRLLEAGCWPDTLGAGDGFDDLVRRHDAVRGRGHQPVQPLANLQKITWKAEVDIGYLHYLQYLMFSFNASSFNSIFLACYQGPLP